MITAETIQDLVSEKLDGTSLFAVDINVSPGNAIKIELDGDNGISIDDCVALSRHIEGSFDREQEDFELKVMSAGIGEALKVDRQYHKNLGREVDVRLLDGTELIGHLLEVADNIKLKLPASKKKKLAEREIEIAKSDIIETRVRVSFK
jgi:ribosome maturation factor RimP